MLKKLADKLKAVKLRKVKTGHAGEIVKVKLDKPSEVEFSSHGNDVDSKNTDTMPELDVVPNKRITFFNEAEKRLNNAREKSNNARTQGNLCTNLNTQTSNFWKWLKMAQRLMSVSW